VGNPLTARARSLRSNPTEPELRLWQALRASQLGGHKFRRQASIARYFADFLCPAKALIVEIDGDTHVSLADAMRDVALDALGYRTLRFSNADVIKYLDGVLQVILIQLEQLPDRWPGGPHPNPSPEGEGPPRRADRSPSPSGEGLGVGAP